MTVAKKKQFDHCVDALRYAAFYEIYPMPKLTRWQRFKRRVLALLKQAKKGAHK